MTWRRTRTTRNALEMFVSHSDREAVCNRFCCTNQRVFGVLFWCWLCRWKKQRFDDFIQLLSLSVKACSHQGQNSREIWQQGSNGLAMIFIHTPVVWLCVFPSLKGIAPQQTMLQDEDRQSSQGFTESILGKLR